MFQRLSNFVITHPRRILLTWLLMWGMALPFATKVSSVLSSDVGTASNSQALVVQQELQRNFDQRDGYTVYLLSPADAEINHLRTPEAYEAFINALRQQESILRIDSAIEVSTLPLSSEDGSALAIIRLSATSFKQARAQAEALKEALPPGHLLTGGVALENELTDISQADIHRAELFGLPISLFILIFAFGAIVAASLPLITAMISVTLSLAALFAIGQMWTFASYAQIIVTMLGLATGIDYALVIINRFREELRNGRDAKDAAAVTTRSAGRAVLSSGITVIIALGALLIPRSQFVQSIGVGGIVVLVFSVSISITLLPALLSLMGHRVNALSITWLGRQLRRAIGMKLAPPVPGRMASQQLGQRSHAFWLRWATRILRYPWAWAGFGTAALILLSLPAIHMQLAVAGIQNFTRDVEARQSYELLKTMDLDSLLKSYDILIDLDERGFYHPSAVRKLSQFTRDLTELAPVRHIIGPTYAPSVPPLILRQYYATAELAQSSPLAPLVSSTVSDNSRQVLVQVFPTRLTANSDKVALQHQLHQLLAKHELSARIGGNYIAEYEWQESIYRVFPYAVVLVYITTFILLALLFHSILIPLKTIIVNTLTVLASFGIITLVVQQGYGGQMFGIPEGLGFIESAVPLFIFATVFGISMDYEVFMMARVFEAHQQGKSDREAVTYAIAHTGSVISNAAAIMVIVFAVFLFSRLILIKTLSLGLSVAVLLDATLVRLAIVPATMLLLGRLNWWFPAPLARLAKRLDLQHE